MRSLSRRATPGVPDLTSPKVAKVVSELTLVLTHEFRHASWETAPGIVIRAMKYVELYRVLSGPEKKVAVIESITALFDASDVAGSMEPFLLRLLPRLIDQFVEVDKGEETIKLRTKPRSKVLRLLCCCGRI